MRPVDLHRSMYEQVRRLPARRRRDQRTRPPICARLRLTHLTLDEVASTYAADASLAIFGGGGAIMDSQNPIIADLSPFRGPSADAGTVYGLATWPARRAMLRLQQQPRFLSNDHTDPRRSPHSAILMDHDGLSQ